MIKSKKIAIINQIISESSYIRNRKLLERYLVNTEFCWYFLNKLPVKFVNFEELDFLWHLLFKNTKSLKLFKIFNENIEYSSYTYILNFLHDEFINIYKEETADLLTREVISIVKRIVKLYPESTDLSFNFTTHVLKIRKKNYRNFEIDNRLFELEKKSLAGLLYEQFLIYLKNNQETKIKKVINLIDKSFNLIDDDGEYSFYTPNEIFYILKDYIIETDFEKRFIEVTELLINQYQNHKLYKKSWKGWELFASGISQSGDNYSIYDRHFISMTLEPALNHYYGDKQKKAWDFINNYCITRDQNNISSEKPDFLNRSTLKILLREYKSGENTKVAFNILKDFINMLNGIPHKSELIFLSVYSNSPELNSDKKLKLVKCQLTNPVYYGLPANIFVEKITANLAQSGNKEASEFVLHWSKNQKYREKQDLGQFTIIENTIRLLRNDKSYEYGLAIFKNYIFSEEFITKLSNFKAWDASQCLLEIISKDLHVGIEILTNIWKTESLTINQQILICESMHALVEKNIETALQVYNVFLKPKLDSLNSKELENKIDFQHARESLVKFAEKLSKAKRLGEALWLVKKLIKDSDPSELVQIGHSFVKNTSLHEQVVNGENPNTVESVRGWCAWVLQKFMTVEGRDHLEDVIDLTGELTRDRNYYVRVQSCIPLIELVKNRHAVLPNSDERFMTLSQASKIEMIAFDMLNNLENQKLYAVMKNLAKVFSYMRSLTTDQALHVLRVFSDLHMFGKNDNVKHDGMLSSVIGEVAPLFVFYAEFRKDIFKAEKYRKLYGQDLWIQLNKFNDTQFKVLLNGLLKNGTDSVKSGLAWKLGRLHMESGLEFERAFKISYSYMLVLANKYSSKVFKDIFNFIEDNLDKKPNECLDLWKKCLSKEKSYLKKHLNDKSNFENSWTPCFYNGKILKTIADIEGKNEFLKWFYFLVNYPKNTYIDGDLNIAIDELKTFSKDNKQVKMIFNKLVDRNISYSSDMESWKNR